MENFHFYHTHFEDTQSSMGLFFFIDFEICLRFQMQNKLYVCLVYMAFI